MPVSRSSESMPRSPWNGVRSSWLMLARKVLLAWLAASASWRATRSTPVRCSMLRCPAAAASVSDRGSRIVRGLNWTANLAGAVLAILLAAAAALLQ